MTQVWRLHARPLEAGQGTDPTTFSLEQGDLGVAWGDLRADVNAGLTPDEYEERARAEGYGQGDLSGWRPVFNALARRMQPNDLCWVRDMAHVYYIGRVDGGQPHCALHTTAWHYYGHDRHFRENNLNQGRTCHWVRAGTAADIAGVIKNRFIRGQAVCQIHDPTAIAFSQHVYNELARDYRYEPQDGEMDMWQLLSQDDCEDLVGAWLQVEKGYYVVASTCKLETPTYEFELIHRQTGKKAFVQVKSGVIDLNRDNYAGLLPEGKVFLLTTGGRYAGSEYDDMCCLDPNRLKGWAIENRKILPGSIRKWLAFLEDFKVGG